MRRERWERFPRHRGLAIPTCITARAWCMPGSLTSGFLFSRLRGKRSRRMRNPQLYVSGKRPMFTSYFCFFYSAHYLPVCLKYIFAAYDQIVPTRCPPILPHTRGRLVILTLVFNRSVCHEYWSLEASEVFFRKWPPFSRHFQMHWMKYLNFD